MAGLGIALLLAGVALVVAEAHLASAGALGALGTAAAVAGAVIAVDAAGGGLVLGIVLALLVALVLGGFLAVAGLKVARSALTRPRAGREALIGRHGRARADGRVLVEGALWEARNSLAAEPIAPGDEVVVERVDGLTLCVRKAEPWELVR